MPPAPRPRVSRRLRWVLGLSLALNLIVVGFLAGAAFRLREGGPGALPDPRHYGTAYVRALPREDRRALRRALRREARDLVGRAERRAHYAAILEALRRESLAPTELETILAEQARTAEGLQTRAQRLWLGVVLEMSPAERAAYADALEAELARGPRGKKGGPRPAGE